MANLDPVHGQGELAVIFDYRHMSELTSAAFYLRRIELFRFLRCFFSLSNGAFSLFALVFLAKNGTFSLFALVFRIGVQNYHFSLRISKKHTRSQNLVCFCSFFPQKVINFYTFYCAYIIKSLIYVS